LSEGIEDIEDWGVTPVGEHLPNKPKALGSNSSTAKKKKKKERTLTTL
jgi:hypothetical protein